MAVTRAQAKLIRRLRSRKRREEEGAFLVEGIRQAEELLSSDLQVELVVTSATLTATPRGEELRARLAGSGCRLAESSITELQQLSDTETSQGVLAIVQRPRWRLAEFRPERRPFAILVFDRVGDPGNLGTLLRTARALDVAWAVALPSTVDPWGPKTVRAAAGATFHLPVSQEAWPEVLAWLRANDVLILCADAAGRPVPRGGAPEREFALVVGSEASGVSQRIVGECDRRVAVKLAAGVDSLNVAVAGALLLDRLTAGWGSEPGR